jgi:hypothetical protein
MEDYKNTNLANLKYERWYDIHGYEGYYQVSNKQRIKSLSRVILRNGNLCQVKSKILRQNYDGNYLRVSLYKDVQTIMTVHRIVATQFVPNPKNLPEVNHDDGVKINNKPSNLKWTNRSKNLKHAYKNGLCSQHLLGENDPRRKAVIQMTKDNVEINRYSGMHEAARQTGVKQASISHACRNNGMAGNFKWIRA